MADCSCQTGAAARRAAQTQPMSERFPVPEYPPREWFYERPDWLLTPPEAVRAHVAAGGHYLDAPVLKLRIDDDGRAAGYFHEFGQCLVHDGTACPAYSPTHHSGFHQGFVTVEDGSSVPVGIIANVGGHADPYASVSVAQDHYADPNLAIVTGRAYDDEFGSYVLGAVVPWATYGDVARANMHPLSGDWRPMSKEWWKAHGIPASVVREVEGFDSIGPTFVNRPGLPLPRRPIAASVEEALMAEQPAPIVVHQHFTQPAAPPGPVIDPARAAAVASAIEGEPAVTAAGPPPGVAPAGGGESDSEPDPGDANESDELEGRVAQLEQDVSDLKDAVGQIIDLLSQPMQSAAELPPEQPATDE